jgi:hypothetical protein
VTVDARRRWGRAGVPLTDADARAHDQRAHRARHRAAAAEQDAHRRWQAGELVPPRITTALDLHGLEGPEVDVACGAVEPDVDRWEAGELYPTWAQLQALARLTDLPLRFFFLPPNDADGPMWTTLDVHLRPGEPWQPPITRFAPGAFTAAPTPIQGALWPTPPSVPPSSPLSPPPDRSKEASGERPPATAIRRAGPCEGDAVNRRARRARGARSPGLFGFVDGKPTDSPEPVPDNPRSLPCRRELGGCGAAAWQPCTRPGRGGRVAITGVHDVRKPGNNESEEKP